MPSGYTANIAKGITFEQYALNCARAFGALIMMRDEPNDAPIPEQFERSKYHDDALVEARERHGVLQAMTAEEIERACTEAFEMDQASYERRLADKRDLRLKYEAMLAKAIEYKAPSPEHVEYKAFMEKQIRESIEWDCSESHMDQPKRLTNDEWLARELASAARSVEYHTAELAKEIERTNGRNLWIKQLRESLASRG